MIRVAGAIDVTGIPTDVDIANYAPLHVSYATSIGRMSRLIFVGDTAHPTDFYFDVPDNSLAVRGMNLLVAHKEATTKLAGGEVFRPGLPILALPPDANDIGHAIYVTDITVSVYLDRNQMEIQLGDPAKYDRGLTHDRVTFLIGKDRLLGVRIGDLSAEEHDSLGYHLKHHP